MGCLALGGGRDLGMHVDLRFVFYGYPPLPPPCPPLLCAGELVRSLFYCGSRTSSRLSFLGCVLGYLLIVFSSFKCGGGDRHVPAPSVGKGCKVIISVSRFEKKLRS